MTEDQFQKARKIMQQANYRRGIITQVKMEISRLGARYEQARLEMKPDTAEKFKAKIEIAITRLKAERERFEQIKFPE